MRPLRLVLAASWLPLTLPLTLSFLNDPLRLEPPRIESIAVLATRNNTAAGSLSILLSACAVTLPAHAVLGIAEGSASEEWVRARDACGCGEVCELAEPLRYEHGPEERVSLMPPSFQRPLPGQLLNARPEPNASPQHARAAAAVARAQRYMAQSAHTLSGGPEKLALRRLLAALATGLLCACGAAVLFKVVMVLVHKGGHGKR